MYLTANSQEITLRLQGVLNINPFPDATPRVRGTKPVRAAMWQLPCVCREIFDFADARKIGG